MATARSTVKDSPKSEKASGVVRSSERPDFAAIVAFLGQEVTIERGEERFTGTVKALIAEEKTVRLQVEGDDRTELAAVQMGGTKDASLRWDLV